MSQSTTEFCLPTTVTVRIPDISCSTSKAQKKGWKCWAKVLSSVATPAKDGYAYEGDFTPTGASAEVFPGDLLLHVDQSNIASLSVICVNASGNGFRHRIADASPAGRDWCGPLAKTAREWLAMTPTERLRRVAGALLDESPENREARGQKPLVANSIVWYTWLSGRGQATASPQADLMSIDLQSLSDQQLINLAIAIADEQEQRISR